MNEGDSVVPGEGEASLADVRTDGQKGGPDGREREVDGQDGGPVCRGPALVLTAEELAVLEAAHHRSLTALTGEPVSEVGVPGAEPDRPTGQIDGPGPPGEAGLVQARCSLVARGLLSPAGQLEPDTDLGLLLQALLDVRVAAEAVVVVERLLGDGRRDLRLLHLVPQGGVVEDVHPEGLHGLDLALRGADLLAAVTQLVVPDDATRGEGSQISVEMTDVAALPELLHRPTVLAELTMLRPAEEETGHLVALGPRGCWAGPRPSGRGLLRLSPVEPGWVGELAGGWIRAVVPELGGGTMAG